MSIRILKKSVLFLGCGAVACLLVFGACHFQGARFADKKPSFHRIRKVVVVGFQPALSRGEKPEIFRDPLSGAIFMAEPVPYDVAQTMTDTLFDWLVAQERYELVSPGQAKGVFSSIVYSDLKVGMGPVEVFQEVGKTFKADAVLAGYLYRWREREGTEYGVNRPASVAFDLHLVRPVDGAILWKGKFDKTQRSLSENLLDVATFVKGKGRWMSVDTLAKIGLQKLIGEMPPGPRKSGDEEVDSHSSY